MQAMDNNLDKRVMFLQIIAAFSIFYYTSIIGNNTGAKYRNKSTDCLKTKLLCNGIRIKWDFDALPTLCCDTGLNTSYSHLYGPLRFHTDFHRCGTQLGRTPERGKATLDSLLRTEQTTI